MSRRSFKLEALGGKGRDGVISGTRLGNQRRQDRTQAQDFAEKAKQDDAAKRAASDAALDAIFRAHREEASR